MAGPLVCAAPGGARRLKPALCSLALCWAVAILPGSALAADPLVTELKQRLASAGVESVNDYLSAHPDSAMPESQDGVL